MVKNIYMRIIRRPRQYTLLAILVLLAIPILALNLWVVQKGVVAKVFRMQELWWLCAGTAWTFLTLYWLLRVRRRGLWSFLVFSGVVLALNLYYLVATKNYALAFYALFILILAALYGLHVYRSLSEPYYSSGRLWFEGEPRFVPHILAELRSDKGAVSARLSRIGFEGCYAYPEQPEIIDSANAIQLKLGDLQLECAVELVSKTEDGRGGGLRFLRATADQDKDIRDFIDRVRSAGYVI